jgi:hypothetical protein
VAAQLVASRIVLSSTELVIMELYLELLIYCRRIIHVDKCGVVIINLRKQNYNLNPVA